MVIQAGLLLRSLMEGQLEDGGQSAAGLAAEARGAAGECRSRNESGRLPTLHYEMVPLNDADQVQGDDI